MSVAFRREGDEEHLEPKFEIPIPPGPNLVTPRGLRLIGERVVELEARIAQLEAESAEESEIKAAKRDLRYWQTRQITAELAPTPDGDTVEIGTTVTFKLAGKTRELSIVGDDEADPAAGLVSWTAPLARAMIGAEAGEFVEFNDREDAIEVMGIAAPTLS
ncbi:GreA/GreB family elongation factor [Novosphingobium sp. JCM 18896]|uniref:GreA/GreB family elongation factor n=1 Tax=Novosphingobium sp. JCM 18896 TaxID=2989731 RepID=UPI00222289D8|nr:GreA/GreB family elongation factor [Novosphingobium sp. JCM 18896]MCW1430567.1 GreA/GreB family elongation factor [Novosphingobium sp. JCM 18896]